MLFGKYINKYYLKFCWLFLIGLIGLVAVDVFQLFIPEYLGKLVDMFDGGAIDKAALKEIILGVMVVAIVMFFGRIMWRLSIFNASQRIEAGLRHTMFLKSERLSQRYYHENKVGTVMAWFTTDLETIEEFFGWGSVMLVDALFLSVLALYKMFSLDWALSCLLLIPLALIVVWGMLVEKFMALKWEQRQNEFDKLYDFSQESFTGIRVIKAFVKETQQLHAFTKIAKRNKDANIELVKVSVIFDAIIEIIIAAIMALILGLGGYFVYRYVTGTPVFVFGHEVDMTAGGLITFVGYFDTLVWPMIALGQVVTMRSRSKASLKRITNFLDQEEEIRNVENAYVLENVKGEIRFDNFSFAYPSSEANVLKNITFTVNPGESVGIVGKIGSGKTTLVNTLLHLYNVERGKVFIDGHDIMDCNIESLRDAIGYVPQDNFLFSDKVKNNIAFSCNELDMDKVYDAAKFADVHSNIEEFTEGYETVSGERGVTLSGGQKQRISIARAYIKDAPIMILDDSVSAVDVKTEETILANIQSERKGKTTIVIASRVSTVSHLDKILVLDKGEVEAYDTPQRLEEISPTYKKMVYLQKLEREVEGGEA
jgi:ABC transporter related